MELDQQMDNILKAIVTAGVANLLTGNLVIAICAGWSIYIYESQKDSKSDTIA
jgi:hypothetical protein